MRQSRKATHGAVQMDQHDTVSVYSFRVFEVQSGTMTVATFKATREAIVSSFGGEPIDGTREEVARVELDNLGRYRRIATGWGSLC